MKQFSNEHKNIVTASSTGKTKHNKHVEWDGMFITGERLNLRTPPTCRRPVSFCLGSRIWCPDASVASRRHIAQLTLSKEAESGNRAVSSLLQQSHSSSCHSLSSSSYSSSESSLSSDLQISTDTLKQQLSMAIKQLDTTKFLSFCHPNIQDPLQRMRHVTTHQNEYCRACKNLQQCLENSTIKLEDEDEIQAETKSTQNQSDKEQKHVCLAHLGASTESDPDDTKSSVYSDYTCDESMSDIEDVEVYNMIAGRQTLKQKTATLRRQDTTECSIAPPDWKIEERTGKLLRRDTTECSIAPPDWKIEERIGKLRRQDTTEWSIAPPDWRIEESKKSLRRQDTNACSLAPPDWRIEDTSDDDDDDY